MKERGYRTFKNTSALAINQFFFYFSSLLYAGYRIPGGYTID